MPRKTNVETDNEDCTYEDFATEKKVAGWQLCVCTVLEFNGENNSDHGGRIYPRMLVKAFPYVWT